MNAEQITAIINLGAAGAVIVVVIYFLRFIEKRDKDSQEFFRKLMDERDVPIKDLAEAIRDLLSEFQNHDVWEHTKLDEMQKVISERKTQPRTAGK